jgi:hypothetical protein
VGQKLILKFGADWVVFTAINCIIVINGPKNISICLMIWKRSIFVVQLQKLAMYKARSLVIIPVFLLPNKRQ